MQSYLRTIRARETVMYFPECMILMLTITNRDSVLFNIYSHDYFHSVPRVMRSRPV